MLMTQIHDGSCRPNSSASLCHDIGACVKSSSTQRRQNGVHVVCSTPPPSSTSHWIVGDRYSFRGCSYVCPRPWDMSMDTHLSVSACQFLLRRPTTNTLYPSIVAAFVVGNTDGGVHLVEGRLLQRCTSRPSET